MLPEYLEVTPIGTLDKTGKLDGSGAQLDIAPNVERSRSHAFTNWDGWQVAWLSGAALGHFAFPGCRLFSLVPSFLG